MKIYNLLEFLDISILSPAQRAYLNDYENNSMRIEMLKDFRQVVKNIDNLEDIFKVRDIIDKISLYHFLIQSGLLSTTMSYKYTVDDLKEIMFLNKFDFSLVLFRGKGCCRNISILTKELLTLKGITNDVIVTEGFHKDKGHMFNYIKENDYEFFADLTPKTISLLSGDGHIAKAFYSEEATKEKKYPLYIFDNSNARYYEAKPLSKEKQQELITRYKNNISLYKDNISIFLDFYKENYPYYQLINKNYDKIYEEQKILKFK